MLLSFASAAGAPEGTLISNQASATFIGTGNTPQTTSSNRVTTRVRAVCDLSVLPNGSVSSPGQTVTAAPGDAVYLPYLLVNTGNAANDYALEAIVESGDDPGGDPGGGASGPSSVLSVLWDENKSGAPDPGEPTVTRLTGVPADATVALLVKVELPATAAGELFVNLVAACADDAADDADEARAADTDNVSRVSVVLGGFTAPKKTADPAPPHRLYPGADVRYSVTFTVNDAPLREVVIRDVLEPELGDPMSYTDGLVTDPETGLQAEVEARYDAERRTLTWRFASVPAKMTVRLELVTTVRPDAPADVAIENRACVVAAGVKEACSAAVRHALAPVELLLEKTAAPSRVTIGDTLTYRLTIRNPSDEVAVARLALIDTLPAGLRYLPGSAVLRLGDGDAMRLEPEVEGRVLRWSLPRLAPGQHADVRFEADVTVSALAVSEIVNTAELVAFGARGERIARSADGVATPLEPGIFRANAVLLGRAYLDRNANGVFDDALDTPVPGVRLYLSNGLSTVTDDDGRYTFVALEPGLLALNVDGATLPPNPLAKTAWEEKPGLWRVRLERGSITRQDIPFEAVGSESAGSESAGSESVLSEALAPQEPAPAPQTSEALDRRDGALILFPPDGALIRDRDSVTVRVVAPLHDQPHLTLNGREIGPDRLGERVYDEGQGQLELEFVGLELEPGPNRIVVTSTDAEGRVVRDEATVHFAGPPAEVTLTPKAPLVADSAAPLTFDLTVRDAWGKTPLDGFLTLRIEGTEPITADADPMSLGFQVRFVEGRAEVALEPVSEPTRLRVTILVGEMRLEQSFVVGSDLRPWVVSGVGSVGAAYQPGAGVRFGVSGSVFARGPVLDAYLLTVGVRYPEHGTGEGWDSFPISGSSGGVENEAASRQGFFVRFERDLNYLQYGDFTTGLVGPLLGGTRSYTGLVGHYETEDGLTASGYAAYVATSLEVNDLDLPSDGTSFYRLPDAPIVEGSLRVAIVKKDAFDARVVLESRSLVPGLDFTADARTGVIQLAHPLPLSDERGNPYALRVSYRLPDLDAAPRGLQFGVQAAYRVGAFTPRLGVAQEAQGAAFTRVVAAGLGLDLGALQGDVEVAYGAMATSGESSGGFALATSFTYENDPFSAAGRYQVVDAGYRSLTVKDAQDSGASFGVEARYRLSDALSVTASGEGKERLVDGQYRWSFRGDLMGAYRGAGDLTLDGARLGSQPQAHFGLEYDEGVRLALGVGLRDLGGVRGLDGSVRHRQGLGGARSATDFELRYALQDDLGVRLTERLEWGVGSALFVGLEGGFDNADVFGFPGRTTATAQYELTGGLAAEAGRLLLGVTSLYPLSETVNVEGSLEQVIDLGDGDETATVVTLSGTHQSEKEDGNLRFETRVGKEVKHHLTAGATFAVSDELFGAMTLAYLSDTAQAPREGFEVSVAAAYRGEGLDLLAHHAARVGNLAPAGRAELSGDVRLAAPIGPTWELRAGYLYRYLEGVGFQDLVSLGSSVALWKGGSLNPSLLVFRDWTAKEMALGVGLELSQRLGCGLYGVVGYHLGGLDAEPSGAGLGQPGFYLRADVVFDEEWRCGRGAE